MNRLTTDKPQGNFETMINFAYAKDGEVWLRGVDYGKDAELCAYIAHHALNLELCGITNKENVIDACGESDCFCSLGALFAAATQAAELRSRLAYFEDAEAQGRLPILPCKVGDTVFCLHQDAVCQAKVLAFYIDSVGVLVELKISLCGLPPDAPAAVCIIDRENYSQDDIELTEALARIRWSHG